MNRTEGTTLLASFIPGPFAIHNIPSTTAMLSAATPGDHILIQANNFEDHGIGEAARIGNSLIGIALLTHGEVAGLPNVVSNLKRAIPHSQIVVGGTPVSADIESVKEIPGIDLVVAGDGMGVWPTIVETHHAGKHIASLVSTMQGLYTQNSAVPSLGDSNRYTSPQPLTSFPKPDLDHITPHITERMSHIDQGQSTVNILRQLIKTPFSSNVLTAINCTFACNYCINTLLKRMKNMGRKNTMETREISQVLSSIGDLVNIFNVPILPVWLQDPDIFQHPQLLIDLITELDKSNFKDRVQLGVDARIDSLTDTIRQYGHDVLVSLFKGKFFKMYLAPETLGHEVQASIKKDFSLDDLSVAITFAAEIGAVPHVQLIAGLLHDTTDSLSITRKHILKLRDKLKPFILNIHRNTPIEGTAQHLLALKKGLITPDMQIPDLTHGDALMPTISGVSIEELNQWRIKLTQDFYSKNFIARASADSRVLLQDEIPNSFSRSFSGKSARGTHSTS